MRHPSTPSDRVVWIGQLLAAEGRYGAVTALSRQTGVPRQTLTTWRADGRQALLTALAPVPAPPAATDPALTRAVLTLLVCGHASYRGIQTCLAELWGRHVGLGTIQAIVAAAERQAQACLDTLAPPQPGALALDELFNGDAQAAYLSAVDARTGVVWATAGPVAPDAESWTLLLWDVQERGGHWPLTLHDGGHAAAAGAAAVDPAAPCARDVWHVLARWGQTQHRLDVRVAEAQAKLALRERYETAAAAGRAGRGKRPTTSAATQAAVVAQETGWAEAVRFLGQEVRRALEVVVLLHDRVQDPVARRQEVEAALALLAEVAAAAPPPVRRDLERLHAHTIQALPGLLTCAALLAPVETAVTGVLGAAGVGLLGWAWQRRMGLELDDDGVVAGLPATWQPAARMLLHAWSSAVRTTSLAESWHSSVRAHVAVHRGLPPGLLALLAVWHNHRVVARGRHAGTSPLQRSGLIDAPTDWLTALGYPPPAAAGTLIPFRSRRSVEQEVAA
jgi:hypothetical protein